MIGKCKKHFYFHSIFAILIKADERGIIEG